MGQLFLDSGAHSLYNEEVLKKKGRNGYDFFESKEFWAYVDKYAAFVKKYEDVINYYVNVDVIFNPKKSWEVLKYLEQEHGLKPLPVIHCGAGLEWVEKHLEVGYEFIGIGGLGQGITSEVFKRWADSVFELLCPPPKHLPIVRTHGFAMTAFSLMRRYPFWSVDSATWTKVGAYGGILVPHKRGGKFSFEKDPYQMPTSKDSPLAREQGKHFATLSRAEQAIICEWLQEINVPLGEDKPLEEGGKLGVLNHHSQRKIANLIFFERLRQWLPEYPWAFKAPRQATLRIFG